MVWDRVSFVHRKQWGKQSILKSFLSMKVKIWPPRQLCKWSKVKARRPKNKCWQTGLTRLYHLRMLVEQRMNISFHFTRCLPDNYSVVQLYPKTSLSQSVIELKSTGVASVRNHKWHPDVELQTAREPFSRNKTSWSNYVAKTTNRKRHLLIHCLSACILRASGGIRQPLSPLL